MKIKFLIAKAGCHNYWHYYNANPKAGYLPEYRNDPPIINELADCFINGSIEKATKSDTYEEAQAEIEKFNNTVYEKREGDEIILTYPGVGIYRIEKIFVIELP